MSDGTASKKSYPRYPLVENRVQVEIMAYVRDNLARYKAPRTVVFGPLPKTSTGKIQKFVLRDKAGKL